jgi:hypothetical protein
MRCRASGWLDSPHSFTAADRAAGHRHDLSILQAEFSLTQMLDTPIPTGPARLTDQIAATPLRTASHTYHTALDNLTRTTGLAA